MGRWRQAVGWPDYEVSTEGEVRRGEHVMRQWFRGNYLIVKLRRDGRRHSVRVHKLVTSTFIGPCPEGMQTRHLNDDRTDNRLVNLKYGTPKENQQDSVRNGSHRNASKTRCKNDHPLSGDNVRIEKTGRRRCLTCQREYDRHRYYGTSTSVTEENE